MILLADSGSTKTEWILIKEGKLQLQIESIGLNPYFVSPQAIEKALKESELLPYFEQVKELHFYGAGCSNEERSHFLKTEFSHYFKQATIQIKTDIEAALMASAEDEPCTVCILGTGSTFRHFDGKNMIRKYSSLSYIMGDEGSGTYIAKSLLRGIFYQNFDQELIDKFFLKYPINSEILLEKVYQEERANRYLASFVPFCKENIAHPQIENLILNAFEQFYLEHLYKYKEYKAYPVHFIGSIAYHFEEQLSKIAQKHQFKVGKIIQKPLGQIAEKLLH
ncbi:MAG: hypothetical protein H6579_08060 [Chitinophagales bacterium]|nr:hypothetical protein [Chitinophagales bacterium]